MRCLIASLLFLLPSAVCCAQKDPAADPVTISGNLWQIDRKPARKIEIPNVAPAREITADDKLFERRVRDSQMRGAMPDPSELSPDGRRAALDKIDAEAATTPRESEIKGYTYRAAFKNNSGKKVAIIYWEYRFTELAHPANVVSRQFLCSANIAAGDKKDLWAFSTLGPSEVITPDSLLLAPNKVFDEKVYINRIEFSDDTVLQRRDWKFNDVKKAVDRATSTPWGNELCRPI